MMTLENAQIYQNLASAIQSIVVAAALIIGGLWSVFVLRKQYEARLGLQKLEADLKRQDVTGRLELQKLELELKRQAVIEITIEAVQTLLPGDTSRYVSAIVDVQNTGTRNTRFGFQGNKPFSVSPVKFSENGELEFGNKTEYPVVRASFPQGEAPSVIVRAGGRERLPFFFRVDSAGLYFLAFTASLSQDEQQIAHEEGARYSTTWVGKKYLVVE